MKILYILTSFLFFCLDSQAQQDTVIDGARRLIVNCPIPCIYRCSFCYVKNYYENEKLKNEGSYNNTDVPIGKHIRYSENGNVEAIENYVEVQKDVPYWGFSVPHGVWIYFNSLGDTLYSEYWERGRFIKQEPEQDTNILVGIDLKLKSGEHINSDTISYYDFKNIIVDPKYKNHKSIGKDYYITFFFSQAGTFPNIQRKKWEINQVKNLKNFKEVLNLLNTQNKKLDKNKNAEVSFAVYDYMYNLIYGGDSLILK